MYECLGISRCVYYKKHLVCTCTHSPAALLANEIVATLITLLWSVWNMFNVIHAATDLAGVYSLVKMTVIYKFS